MKHTLKVTSIHTMAFDNQAVHADNDDVAITLRLKNQSDHGRFNVGDSIEVEIGIAPKRKGKGK